ncbi:MAG: Mrp/NBP35 family ATP-binding protein [Deltaproteobacteria bacterium]|nr:Mrp/NBP35 family ATP-binding protein [Deltaproteobacteria bacterium]
MFWNKKSSEPTENDERLMAALATVNDPELHKDLVTLGMVKKAVLDGTTAHVGIELTTPACPLKETIRKDVATAIAAAIPGTTTEIDWSAQVKRGRFGGGGKGQQSLPGMEEVANVVLVASGKGGVGKSTVATNLACALARTGAKVGLLDADIYGPSIPTMFNEHSDVVSADGKTIQPITHAGLKLMSMGFLVPAEKGLIWRGPMLTSAVTQFLRDVAWGDLDYLIVDLPPGTGDVQLTFAQALKVTGAVVVSTPQDVALADVVRAKAMFDQVQIPVLGLIENMSYFVCDGCDKKHYIFNHGGAKKAAQEMRIPYLGELPLVTSVREAGDAGTPIVLAEPESEVARTFVGLGRMLAGGISVLNAEAAERAQSTGRSKAAGRSLPIIN